METLIKLDGDYLTWIDWYNFKNEAKPILDSLAAVPVKAIQKSPAGKDLISVRTRIQLWLSFDRQVYLNGIIRFHHTRQKW